MLPNGSKQPLEPGYITSVDDEPLPNDISGDDIHAKLRALRLDEGTLANSCADPNYNIQCSRRTVTKLYKPAHC
jgi:hypothetical protein